MLLTKRQQETLQYIAHGFSNKAMAAVMGISEHTAKFHVLSVMRKLDVNTKAEAVFVGIREGHLPVSVMA